MSRGRKFDFGRDGNRPAVPDNVSVEFAARLAVVVESHKFLLLEVEALETMTRQQIGGGPNIGIVELAQRIGVLEDVREEELT